MSEFTSTNDEAAAAAAASAHEATNGGTQLTKQAMELLLKKNKILAGIEQKKRMDEAMANMQLANSSSKVHKFWDTQPVPKKGATIDESDCGPIEPNQPLADLRQEPYPMPAGFEWSSLDINDPEQLDELYVLLNENYVEDDDNMFRFDYSKDFLMWALTPPKYNPELHVGVRSQKSKKLMAVITGVPATMRVIDKSVEMVEINFLCVHKKLRSKRLAPVLIKEVTRRVNCSGVFQAVYTAGVELPKPIGVARYYHRSLNPKKLVEVGFSRKPHERMTWARVNKRFAVPEETSTPGLRTMQEKDIPGATRLLVKYLKKFKVAPLMSEDDVRHWILPRSGVVNAYVSTNKDGEVNNLCSFYHLPSSVMKCKLHSTLNAAYSYYNVAGEPDVVTLTDLMKDCLTKAKHEEDQDVFNALNLMENEEFLEPLLFGKGDGNLHYYLYNWKVPSMKSGDIGLVLL